MYNGFQYVPNEAVETYIGTLDTDDFEDAYIEKILSDIGIVCYQKISESSGEYTVASYYYVPSYDEGVFSGYIAFTEGGGT